MSGLCAGAPSAEAQAIAEVRSTQAQVKAEMQANKAEMQANKAKFDSQVANLVLQDKMMRKILKQIKNLNCKMH